MWSVAELAPLVDTSLFATAYHQAHHPPMDAQTSDP